VGEWMLVVVKEIPFEVHQCHYKQWLTQKSYKQVSSLVILGDGGPIELLKHNIVNKKQ
jgi:hypothetical protein